MPATCCNSHHMLTAAGRITRHGKARRQYSRQLQCFATALGPKHSSSSPGLGSGSSSNGIAGSVAGNRSSVGSSAAAARQPPGSCLVRPAVPADYWPIADLHCSAFYPRAAPFWFSLLRLDRVISLELGLQRSDLGSFTCLVAEAPQLPGTAARSTSSFDSGSDSSTSSSSSREQAVGAAAASSPTGALSAPFVAAGSGNKASPSAAALALPVRKKSAIFPSVSGAEEVDMGPLVDLLVRFFPSRMRQRYATTYQAGGLRGMVVLDNMGQALPPKRKEMPNGTVREVPRTGIAYLSNLAVAPCTRRAGIGRTLICEAERVALSWGCRSVALHVDPSNTAAVEMYRRAGYRHVMDQPAWQRRLEGRSVPLSIMMRVLPRWRTTQLEAAAAGQQPEAA
ncbi:hypothetical protein D9Q98_003001 [Chlorella vulgaris]|uniref:N-acetyltransferase domain-containing protein n=1 Tax=Chlorella vulgaris TaxID=3077 RepID=A0A9D4YZD3_CHLVU|nr:hypothetical protein D9Q98_003001 [Chlorella vulgaris]